MEDQGLNNIGLNLALGLGSVYVKKQPPDSESVDGGSASIVATPWPVLDGLQKMETEDPGYGDANTASTVGNTVGNMNPVNDINTSGTYGQLASQEPAAASEDEYVVTYNVDDTSELSKRRIDQSGDTEVTAATPGERPSSNVSISDGLFSEESDQEGEGQSPLVENNSISKNEAEQVEDADGGDAPLSEAHLLFDNVATLSDEQRSLDEIQVVEEGFEDFEEGEIIKDYAQSRHGTSSETFLSQMHFFGGRTWARGRGRRGRGRGRDITNIALKLIETDQIETDGDQSAPVDNVDQIKTVTDSVRSGRGKFNDHRSPALPLRKSTRTTDPKEIDNSSALGGVEQYSRKEATKGRGRFLGSRPVKAKQVLTRVKSKPQTRSPTENEDVDVEYESNDEDTLAAIRASLEDMNKGNNDDCNSKDERVVMTNKPLKEDNFEKVSNLKKVDSSKKSGKTKKSAGNSQKDDSTKKSESLKQREKVTKVKTLNKTDKPKKEENSKNSDDQKKSSKAVGNKVKGQVAAKKAKGKSSVTAKPDKEITNSNEPEEVLYESNDEDTQAAIRASLKELEKEKQRQKEKELEKQKSEQKERMKEKSLKQKKSPSPDQKSGMEDTLGTSDKDFSSAARPKPTPVRRGARHSARLSGAPKASNPVPRPLPAKRQVASFPEISAADPTQKKMESISLKQKTRIQTTFNQKEKKKGRSTDVLDFDSLVDKVLQVEESPGSISISSNIVRKGEQKRSGTKRKAAHDDSDLNIDVESDEERMELDTRTISQSPITDFHHLDNIAPHVKLQKLFPAQEPSSSQCSSCSSLAAPASIKQTHCVSDDEHDAGLLRSKAAKRSSSGQCAEKPMPKKIRTDSSQQFSSKSSVTAITPSLDTSKFPSPEGKGDSLTKSVGGMMSYLFGDKLAEECPDGFVVNVRLEVEKKKNDDDKSSSSNSQCCKSQKPELCPCLQKVPDAKLAAVLKERVEKRRDLTVGAKGTLLATILNFMQELETVTSPS